MQPAGRKMASAGKAGEDCPLFVEPVARGKVVATQWTTARKLGSRTASNVGCPTSEFRSLLQEPLVTSRPASFQVSRHSVTGLVSARAKTATFWPALRGVLRRSVPAIRATVSALRLNSPTSMPPPDGRTRPPCSSASRDNSRI